MISGNYTPPCHRSGGRERATEGSDSSQQYKWKTFETLWPRIARNWLELSRLGKGHKKGQGNQFLWTICILPGLCPYLCGKLYCNIPLSSMFKIYDANIIYFHFCIAPTTTAALNTPHCEFLEYWNTQKSVWRIWKHFSCVLDVGIPKIWKKLNSHDGFLRTN